VGTRDKKVPSFSEHSVLQIRVLDRQGRFFGEPVDIEIKHRTLASEPLRALKEVSASGEIAVTGLRRFPQSDYVVTVTPSSEFKPQSQFVTIPGSGTAQLVFTFERKGSRPSEPAKPPDEQATLQIRILDRDGQFFAEPVDIEVKHRTLASEPPKVLTKVSASGEIGVAGLRRFPQSDYVVTVTPSNEFKPQSLFVTVPASGAAQLVVIIEKKDNVSSEPLQRAIKSRAVLSPGWEPGLLIEAFADAELKQGVGNARTDDDGHFEMELSPRVSPVWFRWSQGKYRGRSPKLQPFSIDVPIRVHVYRPWNGPAKGRQRFQTHVRSTSGRPAVRMRVALLEVTLRRCQLLGDAFTDDNGSAVILYDRSALFMDRPDLRLVVFDVDGTPLLESTSASVVLPGAVTRTSTMFAKVAETFRHQGLAAGDRNLTANDLRYVVQRADLPAQAVTAYAAASTLAPQLGVPAEALFALANSDASELDVALEQAVQEDLVSPDLLGPSADLLPRLALAATKLAARHDLGRGSLDDFLATQVKDAELRERLTALILDSRSLSAIRQKLDEQQLAIPQVRFLVDLQSIAGVDVGVAKVLGRKFEAEGLRDGADLALLSTADWQAILEQSQNERPGDREPDGDDDAEQLRARAVALKQRAQRIFPEKVFRAQVNRYADQAPWAARIRSYFEKHPDRTFNSPLPLPDATTNADGSQPSDAGDLAALISYKSVVDLTGDHAAAGPLLNNGVASARQLAAGSAEEFVARFADAFDGDTVALERTHTRAIRKTAALNYASSFLPAGRRPSLCDCAHCKSIFGPAAYLFELLSLFGRYATVDTVKPRSLLSHIDERRPDIIRTHLSCPNTNIEVPQVDLVNEILEDQILAPRGTSVAHNLGAGECLPPSRQTQGTSEERRAIPQNQPSTDVMNLLAASTFPWTLPYDYLADRARSARDRLIAAPEDVALAGWRAVVLFGGTSIEAATRALAASMLDFGQSRARLITHASSLESAWRGEVAGMVTHSGPTLALLKRVAATDYQTLEAVLDTAFVRGGSARISIEPDDFCESGASPRLAGPAQELADVLDRFHRFERLRRHLDWTVRDLDAALRWLGGGLDALRLEQIGILRFLERRLRIAPRQLLVLFSDPAAEPPATLRPRHVVSPFEEQFGIGSATLEMPDAALNEHERMQSVTAQIAKASGESLAMVDRAFSEGLLNPLTSVDDILRLSPAEAQLAYRRAVAATYRLSLWARRLRLDESELLDLIALGRLQIMSTSVAAANQLRDALCLVDLADQRGDWPVKISELRYLVGDDPKIQRERGLSASEIGDSLMQLRQDVARAHESNKPLPEDPRAALRTVLSRLLAVTLPQGTTTAGADAIATDLASSLEWSAFFPARANAADAYLSHTLREWPGLAAVPSTDAAAAEGKLNDALLSLQEQLKDWLSQGPGSPTEWPTSELESVTRSFESVVRERLANPASDGIATLQLPMEALFLAAEASMPEDLVPRIIVRGTEHVEAALQAELGARAASIVPEVERTSRRLQSGQVLADWIRRRLGASSATVATVLDQLLDPADSSQSIVAAFVGDTGSISQRLANSIVSARYFTESAGSLAGKTLLERAESKLVFDWSTNPPVPAFRERPFTVELQVRVPSSNFLNGDGSPATLVIEADGEVDVELDETGGARSILHGSPSDQVRRMEVMVGSVTDPEVTLRVRYTTPAERGARVLRVFARNTDGELDEFQWAALAPVVLRLHRAVLALRDVTIPLTIWTALAPRPDRVRVVDLNALAAGAQLEDWLTFFRLARIVKRVRSREAISALVTLLSGAETTRSDLLQVLNLDEAELRGALQLLRVPDADGDPVVLPSEIDFGQIGAVLNLLDHARRFNLPSVALARWNEANPHDIYEWALAALRVGLDPTEWLKLLAEVHDPVREHLRDAQLDFLIGRDRDGPTGETDFSSREAISDYLLTDVQMSACMTTSRIQFVYAAVQRYVDAGQGSRAPWLPVGNGQEERFAREWTSLQQYRLHEAQMRILVHAENWIDPAIRPTKTPAFERLQQTMTSGPLTLHLAEQAMKEYAASLAEVARLEPVATVTHEDEDRDRPLGFRDSELAGTHVFARTRAHPQRLYYRRRLPQPDGRWTPWERIDADLEGTHYLAAVVFGRLRLICADFSVARDARPNQCNEANETDSSSTPTGHAALNDYEVTLSWIDREHHRWSPVRRSGRFPIVLAIAPLGSEEVFENGLPDHFRTIERDADAVLESIEVQVFFGDDRETMDSGSRLKVSLLGPDASQDLGFIAGRKQPRDKVYTQRDALPSDFDVESKSHLRLEWIPNWDSGYSDDCTIERIDVIFRYVVGGSLQAFHRTRVVVGRMAQQRNDELRPESTALPFKFWGGGTLDPNDGIGPEEDAWKVFEGELEKPFSLSAVEPSTTNVETDYELIPQSVDLSRAMAIDAAIIDDFFDVRIYTVPHTECGRIRSRFKATEQILTDLPEAEVTWGREWVTGHEFPYPITTDHDPVATLRIYPDDTIQPGDRPAVSIGAHAGTEPEGQELVSTGRENETWLSLYRFWFDAGGGYRVYCDARAVATSPVPYKLTVDRHTRLSSTQSPKVLDEEHNPSYEPARTFFVEREPEEAVPDDPPFAIVDVPPSRPFLNYLPRGNVRLARPVAYLPQGRGASQLKALTTQVSLRPEAEEAGALVNPSPQILHYQASDATDLVPARYVWRFSTFWHPQAIGFRQILESRGLSRLVRLENQELSAGTDLPELQRRVDHFSAYRPTRFVDPRWPRDVVDFTLTGPFSEYNWELFFDSLLYIAQRFDEDGQYDEGDEIFALLVDRTRVARPGAWEQAWLYQTAPIRTAVALEQLGSSGFIDRGRLREEIVAQIELIRRNPYQPHLIARGWPTVYARALRIRYVEHLIRAAEADFRRAYAGDNRTYLESASSRFDLAARVLGPADDKLPAALQDDVGCFASLTYRPADEPAEGIEALEPYLPAEILADGFGDEELKSSARWHFCVPANEKLNELRALVADRLMKLRSCQDIDGVRRALSLYGRRIDPALLVRATAEGMDLDVLLGRIAGAKPSLYFQALWQRALQACERARSLEDAWLNAQERADSEEMAQLQNEQEIRALEGQVDVMSQRLEDARKLKEAMDRAIESAQIRHEFYASRKRLNAQEEAEGRSLVEAGRADKRAANDSRAASDWAWFPTAEIYADLGVQSSTPYFYSRSGVTLRSRLGGETGVQVYRANAEGHSHDAAEARVQAGIMGREGSFARRGDEWKHQEVLALKDIQKGEHDRAGAEIRVRIAELELDLHKRRIDDVKTVRTFLRDKFTSKELHAWRANRILQLRYDQHRIAYDLVSQAKAALVREHGLEDQGFVPDPWDISHDGVSAAGALLHQLEKQQQLYMETWRREQEKLKVYSLVERDPLAFLELLQRGEAVFTITEADFDEDGAGDYFRRVRHVSLDIPAVRGPYTNINARLTQLRGEIRVRVPKPTDSGYYREGPDDPRFRDDLANGESIVTNTGVQDDGRLDQRQEGENPPPFGMNGAISTFRIELPPSQNHFDRQTISDVIVRIAVTSRPGGEEATEAAVSARRRLLAERPRPVMLPLHSAFSNSWHLFVDALGRDGAGDLVLTFTQSHIPLWLQPVGRIVQSSIYFALPEGEGLAVEGGADTGVFSTPAELRSPRSSSVDPHLSPSIQRLRLRQPFHLERERLLRFQRRTEGVNLKRGWLVCWLEGTG
jgi:hypothetical protein